MMKNFSTIISEAAVVIPQFSHPDLQTPRDPNGKFWQLIAAANEEPDKASKGTYNKVLKTAKDLYASLISMNKDEEIDKAAKLISDATKLIEKSAADSVDEVGTSDVKQLRTYLYLIANIDNLLKHKTWFKSSHVDVKAGYVPFRGSQKDPKIKYRMVFNLEQPCPEASVKEIMRTIPSASPLHTDYIAGIEWKKDKTAFSVLFTNTPGYKR